MHGTGKEAIQKINGKEDNKKANVNDGIKRQDNIIKLVEWYQILIGSCQCKMWSYLYD